MGSLLILSSIALIAKDKYLVITNDKYNQSEALQNFVKYRSNDFDVVTYIFRAM